MGNYSTIGKSIPRIDALVKVRGTAKYAGDIVLPRMLEAKILRSNLPHARILNIDLSQALKVKGVKAIITGKDTLGKTVGPLRFREKYMDELPLAIDKVRYIGDPVAAVAATSKSEAQEAVDKIKVEYEELPAVFTIEEAKREGAPLVHEDKKGNLSRTIHFNFGDLEASLHSSYYVREDFFTTTSTQHAPLEPHACVADFEAPDKLTIWTSTQVPYFVRSDLARTLGIKEDRIRVILPFVGGGFGGKADGMFPLDFCAAVLSRKTGRPVRLVYTREEEFIAGRRRHPAQIYLKTGVTKEGILTGRDVRCELEGGAYNGFGPATILLCGIFLNLPYRYQAFRYEGRRYYTNNPVASAMRGHGAPQVHFASDVQLDQIAVDIGMDPLEIRLRNALETGEVTIGGLKILSSGFKECLEKVAAKSNWTKKRNNLPPHRGIGIGCSGFPSGQGYRLHPEIPTYSSAVVKLNEDGSVTVLSGAADTGQGSDTLLLQIAAGELGVKPENVRFIRADSDLTPADLGNFSSRETVFAGNAVKEAAARVKEQMASFLARLWEVNTEQLVFSGGKISIKDQPDRWMMFPEAVKKILESRMGKPVVGEGSYDPPDKINYETYTFGAQITELEVDPESGEIRILNVVSAHDCGKAVNPVAVAGQLQGSVHMGTGYALSEAMLLEEGRVLNPSFLDYRIIPCEKMPPMEEILVESNDPEGPFGAKEAGEGTLGPVAPSIVNAVYDATGIRMHTIPLKPGTLLKKLKQKKEAGEKDDLA